MEMSEFSAGYLCLVCASMGPRSFIRGNVDGNGTLKMTLLASMGPRSFIRGNFVENSSIYSEF